MAILNWIRDYLKDIGSSSKKFFRDIVLTSFFWVILIGLALIISTGILIGTTVDNRQEQNMAKYWQNGSEMSYRQMTVLAKGNSVGTGPKTASNEDDYLTLEGIKIIRDNIESKISENKKTSGKNDKKKNQKDKPAQTNWTDCYSTTFDTSASYVFAREINGEMVKTPQSFNANIVAVGGNFKAFHPYEYLSGGFLPTDELDPNICVINDSLSWMLFKSYNVTGEKISIFGEDYQIIGVVKERDSSIDNLTGAGDYRIFCYFSKMNDLNEKGAFSMNTSDDSIAVDPLAITCYEAMLPELVKGVAKTDVLTSLKSYNAMDPQFIIVSNTGRFTIYNVYNEIMPIGENSKRDSQFDFPYWEKAARLSNERLFIEGVLFVFGIIILFIGITIVVLRFSKKLKTGVRTPNVGDIFTEEAT